jgi:hypothetical protein
MQKERSSQLGSDAEENAKALRRAFESKKANPHEGILKRIGYYKAHGRIRLGESRICPWPPAYPKWEMHDDLTVQLYSVDEWNVLNWFIELVKRGDLTQLSPADILGLREESQALQARGIPEVTKYGAPLNEPLSLVELTELQTAVRNHIDQFLKTGSFTFAEFRPTLLIERDPEDIQRLVDYEFLPPFDGKGLLYLFATLLRRVRLPIQRCPYPRCQNIFLKSRKDAGYCSRQCQSVHYAQKQRSNRPPSERGRGRPKKHPEPIKGQRIRTSLKRKKGAKHGTKKQ